MTDGTFKPLLLELLRQAQSDQNAFFAELPAAELAASGTPELWAAKDHVAHMTYWRERLALRLGALLRQEAQPEGKEFEEMNPLVFEEHRHDAWEAALADSERAYAELLALAARLSEEELTAAGRFAWVGDGMPLYTSFMGNCYEHTQNHLAQYRQDRGDAEGAVRTYEGWTNRIAGDDAMPELLRGYVRYNLACFYATHGRAEQAREPLRQAFARFPGSREFARTDADLVALRDEFAQN